MADTRGPGRPALPGEWVRPSGRPRLLASLIDLVAAAALGLGALHLLGAGATWEVQAGVLLVATAAPTVIVEAAIGRSLGKAALQLAHVRPRDGVDRVDLGSLLLRWGLKWLVPGLVVLLLPWTWAVLLWVLDGAPALVGGRRALHDLAAGTRVWELVARER